MKSVVSFTCLIIVFFGFALGCGTVGARFDEKQVAHIQTGLTKKEDIKRLFGKPFRTGIENGREVWVYEHNAYSTFGPGSSKDLIIVFEGTGEVYSHQMMSTSP